MSNYFFLPVLLITLMLMEACTGQPTQHNAAFVEVKPTSEKLPIGQYILDILEDREGNIWIGTLSKGVARYDGKALRYYTSNDGLIDNAVISLKEDNQGNIWMGTHGGFSKFDGKTFTNYGINEGIIGPGGNLLIDRNGQIWAGTNRGAFRFDGEKFHAFELPRPFEKATRYKWVPGKIWSMTEDRKGNIWFAVDGYGACKYNGHTFQHFTQADGLNSNNVTSIVEDAEGNFWFSCISSDFPDYVNEGGLTLFDGKNFKQFPQLEGLHENDIYFVQQDNTKRIWVCATGIGAYIFQNQEVQLYSSSDQPETLENFALQSFLHDSHGKIWCGFSGGLFTFNGAYFQQVLQSDLN